MTAPTEREQRTSIDEALSAWEAKGPTSLTVALLANALYGARDKVARVEAALDIRTRARAWMAHLGYEDHQIDKAEAWRQPVEPWLQDDPPVAVVDLETAAGFAREYQETIRAALDGRP